MADRPRRLIAGNWKMNLLREDARALANAVAAASPFAAEVVLCPPAVLIRDVVDAVAGRPVRIGGQDCHPEPAGAHTGDTAAPLLRDAGCTWVIVGHSERRQDHGETDALVAAKAQAAVAAGLAPIVCIGETEAERDAGETAAVLTRQLAGSIPQLPDGLAVAYEPVWAIGTGRTATPGQVAEAHAHIRARLAAAFGDAAASGIPLLYGGSVKPGNAAELLATANVDGALVGGASLKADDFLAIINA